MESSVRYSINWGRKTPIQAAKFVLIIIRLILFQENLFPLKRLFEAMQKRRDSHGMIYVSLLAPPKKNDI